MIVSNDLLEAAASERKQSCEMLASSSPHAHELAVRFLSCFSNADDAPSYHFVPNECRATLAALNDQGGPSIVQQFLRLVLACAAEQLPDRIASAKLPSSIADLYPRHIERIVHGLSHSDGHSFSIEKDGFIKDLCLLTLRMYPGGGRLIERGCGIPRRLIWQGNPWRSAGALRALLYSCGGFYPYFQFHTHTADLSDFNPNGMAQTYQRVADLLRTDPKCLGVYTASWFNDPAIPAISPRLSYLQVVPMTGGAIALRGVIDENSTAAAISKSATRRQLYESGQYQPRIYYLVWPRRKLLAWADAHPDLRS
jgi:hypothetical protein